MHLPQSLTLPSLALSLIWLASSCSTSVITVGCVRPASTPAEVRSYLHAPAQYEEIAVVRADNLGGSPFGRQAKINTVINRLKVAAANLGTNGIILNNYGEDFTALNNGLYTGSAVAIYVPNGQSKLPAMTPLSQRIMLQ